MMLTVDSITGGNRERDKRTGFSIPFRLNLAAMMQFAMKPTWAINYFSHKPFTLPQLDNHVDMGGGTLSISRYFTEMLNPAMSWNDIDEMLRDWDGQFCLKGIMSASDARQAVEIGCTALCCPIMADDSSTDHAQPSTSLQRSSTLWGIRSTSL